jgi:hypothetical protein
MAVDTFSNPETLGSATADVTVHKIAIATNPVTISKLLAPHLWTTTCHITQWEDGARLRPDEEELYTLDGHLSTAPSNTTKTEKVSTMADIMARTEQNSMEQGAAVGAQSSGYSDALASNTTEFFDLRKEEEMDEHRKRMAPMLEKKRLREETPHPEQAPPSPQKPTPTPPNPNPTTPPPESRSTSRN